MIDWMNGKPTSQAVTESAPSLAAIIANRPVPVPMSSTCAFLPATCRPPIASLNAL